MKVSELKQIIESVISEEVKRTIMEDNEMGKMGKMEKYHIKCEGLPLATFESQEEAEEALPDYKEKHPGKELIIEKGVYESHDDMMNKLDEINDQLEETDNMENTEKQPMEGNEFSGALKAAKDAGEKTFSVDGKEYDVEECWSKEMKEEEECDECGSSYMEEEEEEEDNQSDMDKWNMDQMKDSVKKHFGNSDDEEKEDDDSYFEEMLRRRRRKYKSVDNEEIPNEMNESKKKKILRLTETELTELIAKMVTESVPGLNAYNKAHTESGKENKANLSDVDQKIKKAVSVEGNDNPEFPKQIGKGEKVARQNTKEEDEEVAKNFAGLQNLDYDNEPSEQFKKRLKMAIEGDKLMGNSSEDVANVVASKDAVKKMEKQIKDRQKDKEERVIYKKEAVPTMNESKVSFTNVLNEELEKMKKIYTYDKKTQ